MFIVDDNAKEQIGARGPASGMARRWLVLLSLLFAACGAASVRNGQPLTGDLSFPRTLRNPDGAEITIPHKPNRIVSLTPSADEILCALVDEKRIVGVSKYSKDDATSHIADVARRINVFIDRDPEQIILLQPDLIVAARYTKIDLRDLLSKTGAPIVISTEFHSIAQIEGNVRMIARAVGEESKAETVIGEMHDKLAAARANLRPEMANLRTMYLAAGNFTAGADTSFHAILSTAGLRNAVAEAGITGNIKIASEQMMQIDPDVILISSGYERDRGFRKQLETDAQLSAMKAVKHNRIVELPARNLLTVSHHIADAAQTLVQAINKLPKTEGGE